MTLKYTHNTSAPANNIVESIAAHKEALSYLEKQLPIACAREGHVWDNPEGTLVNVCIREGVWEKDDPECTPRFGSRGGHWAIEPRHEDVFQRKCTRCGCIESKSPIRLGIKSPWTRTSQDRE